MHRGMESRALDQYRLDSMTAKLALDKDAVHRDIVGTIAYERATLAQLQQRLETIEAKHGKQRIGRIDADLALKKALEKHARVAAEKRELVTRFDKLLHAYRSLVEAYMQLKEKYTIVKSIKPLTTSEKVRLSLRKVRELFTQEDEDDPDRLPTEMRSSIPD
ncbi:Hypothetical Protein FCC1311_103742 [Hondaea fermentalgiana]|uniref:Uncharacterized protein n=1 Tax=Hondaea fermentalgiana TaxID=2315210 RepID=A0A2R5GTI4_9STRA|nr:Hypothetical Protein FCC1311_103742 [Hondaea fermentalgiana]|eukprot:GBG34150.1 Hypothetical Protein FCC1311_103742 [Hondaea fermentalgiana]